MARFGADITQSGELGVASTVKEGVTGSSTLDTLQTVSNVFAGFSQMQAGKRQTKQQQLLTQFQNTQLATIDAIDQGKIKADFGRSKLRREFMSFSNSHPALRDELAKVQNSVLGQAGMGAIVMQEDPAERERQMLRDNLVRNGMLTPGGGDVEFQRAAAAYMSAEAATRAYEQEKRAIALERDKLGLSQAQINLLNDREERATTQLIVRSAPAEYQAFRERTQSILDAAGSEADKIRSLETLWNNMMSSSSSVRGMADQNVVDAHIKVMQQHKDLTERLIKGELEVEEAQRQIDNLAVTLGSEMLADPVLAETYTISQLFPNHADIAIGERVNTALAQRLHSKLAGNSEPTNPFLSEELQTVFGDLLKSADTSVPEQVEEQQTLLQGLMDDMAIFDSVVANDPKKMIPTVDFFASPEFLEMRNAGNVDTSQALDVVQNHYNDEVWGLIRREFNEAGVVSQEVATQTDLETGALRGEMTPTGVQMAPEAVTYRPTAMGVEFVAVDPSNVNAKRKARSLNRDLAPIINKTVQATAHIEGHKNYSQVFEQAAPSMFASDGQPAGGDIGDELETGDFTLGGALDEALTTGGYVGDGDYMNATTPDEVAASFIGFDENLHKQILSDFIQRTAGKNLNPAKTAWCAAFVNGALGATGQEGTGQLTARSFLDWGQIIKNPKRGDVVVLARGNEAWMGHVGFFVNEDENYVYVLGGNQDNKVSIERFSKERLLGYRRGKYKAP